MIDGDVGVQATRDEPLSGLGDASEGCESVLLAEARDVLEAATAGRSARSRAESVERLTCLRSACRDSLLACVRSRKDSARPSNHFFRRAPFPPNVFVSNGASSAPVTLTKNVSRSMTCIQAVEEQRTSQIYWPTPKTAGSPASARGATEPRAVSLTPLPVLIIAISKNGARRTPATPRRSPFCPFNRFRPRRFSSPERRSAGSLTARPPPRPVQHHHRLASTYTVAHVRPRSPALRTRRPQDGPPSHLSRSVGPGHSSAGHRLRARLGAARCAPGERPACLRRCGRHRQAGGASRRRAVGDWGSPPSRLLGRIGIVWLTLDGAVLCRGTPITRRNSTRISIVIATAWDGTARAPSPSGEGTRTKHRRR